MLFRSGDKGAKLRRELQYIPGDQMFMPWQQNLLAIDNAERQQKQQQELQEQQAQQQDMQSRHAEAKHQREAEKHQMEIEAIKAQAAANAVKHGNTLRESAKEFGASKASNVGGKVLANPINKMDEQE